MGFGAMPMVPTMPGAMLGNAMMVQAIYWAETAWGVGMGSAQLMGYQAEEDAKAEAKAAKEKEAKEAKEKEEKEEEASKNWPVDMLAPFFWCFSHLWFW